MFRFLPCGNLWSKRGSKESHSVCVCASFTYKRTVRPMYFTLGPKGVLCQMCRNLDTLWIWMNFEKTRKSTSARSLCVCMNSVFYSSSGQTTYGKSNTRVIKWVFRAGSVQARVTNSMETDDRLWRPHLGWEQPKEEEQTTYSSISTTHMAYGCMEFAD